MLTKVFLMPLRESALRGNPADQLMSLDDLKAIFSNVEVLLNVNKQFLADIDAVVENWSMVSKIGSVFLSIVRSPRQQISLLIGQFPYLVLFP
jgi:hypothetical protein